MNTQKIPLGRGVSEYHKTRYFPGVTDYNHLSSKQVFYGLNTDNPTSDEDRKYITTPTTVCTYLTPIIILSATKRLSLSFDITGNSFAPTILPRKAIGKLNYDVNYWPITLLYIFYPPIIVEDQKYSLPIPVLRIQSKCEKMTRLVYKVFGNDWKKNYQIVTSECLKMHQK